MKLNTLVAKPQLIKCELNDEETISEFGESLEWFIYDRQPLSVFLKFASGEGTDTASQIVEVLREMVLDEQGQPIIVGDATLPTNVLMKVMTKMTEVLGK